MQTHIMWFGFRMKFHVYILFVLYAVYANFSALIGGSSEVFRPETAVVVFPSDVTHSHSAVVIDVCVCLCVSSKLYTHIYKYIHCTAQLCWAYIILWRIELSQKYPFAQHNPRKNERFGGVCQEMKWPIDGTLYGNNEWDGFLFSKTIAWIYGRSFIWCGSFIFVDRFITTPFYIQSNYVNIIIEKTNTKSVGLLLLILFYWYYRTIHHTTIFSYPLPSILKYKNHKKN